MKVIKMLDRIQKQMQSAREHFAHHKATYRQFDGISTLDWRHESGTSNYYVRYVFDENRCKLYISGDLGSAVFCLTEKALLPSLAMYSVDYFLKKLECSTDKYRYDTEAAKEELEEELLSDDEELTEEEIEERKELISDLLSGLNWIDGWRPSDDATDRLSEICPCYWEWLYRVGEYIDDRVILWLVGMNMAYEQLRKDKRNVTS